MIDSFENDKQYLLSKLDPNRSVIHFDNEINWIYCHFNCHRIPIQIIFRFIFYLIN